MSWFTDLAGKAESLLNNIDQSAAGAIKQSDDTLSSPLDTSAAPTIADNVENYPTRTPIYSASEASLGKYAVPNTNADHRIPKYPSSSKLDSAKLRTTTPKDEDAALFDFLNSSNKPSTPRSSRTRGKSRIKKIISSTSVAAASIQHTDKSDTVERQKTENLTPQKNIENDSATSQASFHISRSSSIDSINSKQTENKTAIESGSSEGNEPSSEAGRFVLIHSPTQ